MKNLVKLIVTSTMVVTLCGCSMFQSKINDMKGSLVGNSYTGYFYSNTGDNFMTLSGEKINMTANVTKEQTYNSDDGWGYTKTISSVVTVNIDGKEVESCGSTIIFEQKGLTQEVNFQEEEIKYIGSKSSSVTDATFITNIVNKYKNAFGKGRIVVIQSQLGDPLCAYSGDKVYYEVEDNLPKTTKLMIDGKALYIHRANFQILDKSLLK